MFESLKNIIDKGKAFVMGSDEPSQKEEVPAAPPGVTVEDLIRGAKAYVDAIIVSDTSSKDE